MRAPRRTRLLGAAALILAAIAAAFVSVAVGGDDDDPPAKDADAASAAALAEPPDPAFEIPPPVELGSSTHESTWVPVKRAVTARSAPRLRSDVVGRLARRTPEGTTNIVLVVGQAEDAQGSLWLRVRLPVLPNNTTGWVPRSTLGGYGTVRTHLVVDLGDRRATLFRNGKAVFRAVAGVGTAQFPTPRGRFYVRNKLTRYRAPFYGPVAFGKARGRPRSPTGRPAGSSASTGRTGPTCFPAPCHTGASGFATRRSCDSHDCCRSGRR